MAEHNSEPGLPQIYGYYCKLASWTSTQVVALAIGKDPRTINSDYPDHCLPADLARAYVELLSIVKREIETGPLKPLMTPEQFLEWADETGIEVDPRLRDAIAQRRRKSRDPRDAKLRGLTQRLSTRGNAVKIALTTHYGLGTGKSHSKIAKELSRDGDLIGCRIDEGTVLKLIKEIESGS